MAERETAARKKSRAPRDEETDTEADRGGEDDGGGAEAPMDQQELASYLEERIKPGLNRGAIPLLARSIAREIAQDDYHRDEDEEDDEDEAEEAADLEADLHTLQQRLGDDWTLFYAVHGGDAWLTAESQDATQRLEAPTAEVLVKVVELLKQGGGRSGAPRSRPKGDDDSD